MGQADTLGGTIGEESCFMILLNGLVFCEKSIQRRPGDTEDLSGPALVAMRFFQGFDNIGGVEF